MRIDPQKLTATVAAEAGKTSGAAGAEQGSRVRESPPSRADGVDRVQLSPLTDRLTGVLEAERVRQQDRVAALAQQFQAGRYAADAAASSRALVSETLAGPAEGSEVTS